MPYHALHEGMCTVFSEPSIDEVDGATTSMRLPCGYHVDIMWLLCGYHVAAMWLL